MFKIEDNKQLQGKRIVWADHLRAFCILLILWFHTDVYYTGRVTIPYELYVSNALTIFFFISGYFFYTGHPTSLRHKLHSIFRGLLIPYFFFTIVLAVPKALVRHVPVSDLLTHILMGDGSWFVAALIVAEIVFTLVLYTQRKWVLHLLPVAALALSWLFSNTINYTGPEIWNFRPALIGIFFLYVGYQYHRHEASLGSLQRPLVLAMLLVFAVLLKLFILSDGIQMVVEPVIITNYPVFLIDTITIILLTVGCAKLLPSLSWLQWVGRHTLVYYFFCGAVPTFVSMVLPAYQGHYITKLIPYAIVCLLTSLIVWLCYRYLPFILAK